MRHKNLGRRLNLSTAHRRALFRNLATSLVLHGHVETTLPRAKELKRIADKLVTLGKKNSLHARRQAMKFLFAINRTETGNAQKLTAVHKLFEEIAPRYTERTGGYTRVLRTRIRPGDKAQLAVIQFVEATLKDKAPKKRKRRVASEKATTPTAPAAEKVEAKQESAEVVAE